MYGMYGSSGHMYGMHGSSGYGRAGDECAGLGASPGVNLGGGGRHSGGHRESHNGAHAVVHAKGSYGRARGVGVGDGQTWALQGGRGVHGGGVVYDMLRAGRKG